MLNWLRRKILNWLARGTMSDEEREERRARRGISIGALLGHSDSDHSVDAKIRIGLVNAINGKLLEVSTYVPNPHGPDWTHEMYIVQEGEVLSDAIAKVMLMKGLQK